MTIHQCPKCELRFTHRTELEDHIWHDHADFRHEYPATRPLSVPEAPVAPPVDPKSRTRQRGSLVGWLMPKESHGHDREHTLVAPGQEKYAEAEVEVEVVAEERKDAAGPAVE